MASDSSGHTARNDFPNPQTSRNTADIHALYNKDTDQVTIWATLTGDAPRTIDALLNDPRTDDDTGQPATPPNGQTPAQAPISQLGQGTPEGVAQLSGGTLVPAPAVRCLRRGGRRLVPGRLVPGRLVPGRLVPGRPGHACPACLSGALPPQPARTLRPAPAPGRPPDMIVDIYLLVAKVTIHDPLFAVPGPACSPGLAGRPAPGRGTTRDPCAKTAAALP